MSLVDLVDAFNRAFQPAIEIVSLTRDGHVGARLPRVGQDIVIKGSSLGGLEVTPKDYAWLCEETRRAMAPGSKLLEAGLHELTKQQA